jgi:uncharacterized membrane protein
MVGTIAQWIHVSAAVLGVGSMGFVLLVLFPAAKVLSPDQRDSLIKTALLRFRWISWSVMLLLLGSGLYNVKLVWEVPWGTYWKFLTIKITLALAVFAISLFLTLPVEVFSGFRAKRNLWLSIAFALALGVILISAYLRRA